jgi:hypothetical protein
MPEPEADGNAAASLGSNTVSSLGLGRNVFARARH